MTEYIKIAIGANNAAGLARFSVDPLCPGIVPGIVRVSLSGAVGEDGWRSADLIWTPEINNATKVAALASAGLTSGSTIRSAAVTVRLPGNPDQTVYSNYNALAYWDEADQYALGGVTGFVIHLINLVAI